MDRREFLIKSATASTVLKAPLRLLGQTKPSTDKRKTKPIPIVHTTDLFRPHDDPDDHWDLACMYALAHRGNFDLRAILIDYPVSNKPSDPDVMAVAQMNYITGKDVPVLVGPAYTKETGRRGMGGIYALLQIMRSSPEPIIIHIGGAARTVALAAELEPRLFAEKCAGIYLDAGYGASASQPPDLEPNVQADPASFAAIFKIPCPIYWMPCFDTNWRAFQMSEWGTFYKFPESQIMPDLSEMLQNYFLMAYRDGLKTGTEPRSLESPADWLRFMIAPRNEELSRKYRTATRNMWCTAGMFHAAGLAVMKDGEIVPRSTEIDPVFELIPIQIRCAADGSTSWSRDLNVKDRFIFHVRDQANYSPAMTSALRSLLLSLG